MKRMMLAMIALFLFCHVAWGAMIVAKPDATNPSTAVMYKTGSLANCNDTNASFTSTNSHLSNALTAAGASGTLSICSGTYKGSMFDTSNMLGIPYAKQTINGAGTGSTIMDGTNSTTYILDNLGGGNVNISNLTIQNAPSGGYGFNGRTKTASFTDVIFQNNFVPFSLGGTGTSTMTRVKISNNLNKSYYAGGYVSGGTVNCNYCIWENNNSQFRIEGSSTIANIYNSLIIGGKLGAISINTSGAIANLFNTIAIADLTDNSGNYTFVSASGSTYNISNSIILPAGTRPETGFFDGHATVLESNNQYVLPNFVSPRRFGWVSLFIDDTAGWSYFKTVADYANAHGVGIVYAVENTKNLASIYNVSEMATYVANGNEMADHVREVHFDLTNLNAITITGRSGSAPSITVSIDQSDASSANWTGNIYLKEGGTTIETIPVTSSSPNLTDLATAINSQTGWSAIKLLDDNHENYHWAITLANVTDQPVATAYTAQFDQQHYWFYEIAESKAELERGIGNGYVVKTFVYPNDTSNAALQAWVLNASNFTPAGTTSFLIARGAPISSGHPGSYTLSDDVVDTYNFSGGNGFRIAELLNYDAMSSLRPNQSRDLAAMTSLLTYIGGYAAVFSHSAYEYSVAQYETLIDTMLATPGMSIVLPRDAANTIRTSGLWTDVNGDGQIWARHFTDTQDYHLLSSSTAINTGLNSAWSGTANVTDYDGTPITDGSGSIVAPGGVVDIGPYENNSQPAGSIVINNGASYTNSPNVILALSATDPSGISQMCISNMEVCTAWETYSMSKGWSLPIGDGTKIVYAWYKDNLGNIDQSPFTASIILAPLLTIDPPPSSVGQSSFTLTGAMQAGSTITITSGSGATIGPIVYTSSTTWSCVLSNLASGDNVFTVTATSPSSQVTSTTVTVNYIPDGAVPVPALSKPVFFSLAAALFLVMWFADARGARKYN